MDKLNTYFTKILLIFILLISISCKKTPEEIYQESVEKFNTEQDSEAKDFIITDLLNSCSIYSNENYSREDIQEFQNCFYIKSKNIILLDNKKTYELSEEIKFAALSSDTRLLLISDGFSATLLNLETGNIVKTIKLTDNENISIDAVYLNGRDIFYFYKRNLFKISGNTQTPEKLFSDDTFSPPFTKNEFKVNIEIIGSLTFLTVGNAGLYNLSIMNYISGKIHSKNLKISSDKKLTTATNIYYVTGASGKWKLFKYDLINFVPEVLMEFKSLKDLRPSGKYIFIFEDEFYYKFNPSNNEKSSLVKGISLKDIYSEIIILEYNGKYYFTNTEMFFNKVDETKSIVPQLFK